MTRADKIGWGLSLLIGTGVAATVVAITVGVWGASVRHAERERVYSAFMGECIELHLAKRCQEFWDWGRTDLGRK